MLAIVQMISLMNMYREDPVVVMQALKEAPDVLERGFIDKFDNFNAGGKDTPSSYTAMLYNSSIIPCPRGMLTMSIAKHLVTESCLIIPGKEQMDRRSSCGPCVKLDVSELPATALGPTAEYPFGSRCTVQAKAHLCSSAFALAP